MKKAKSDEFNVFTTLCDKSLYEGTKVTHEGVDKYIVTGVRGQLKLVFVRSIDSTWKPSLDVAAYYTRKISHVHGWDEEERRVPLYRAEATPELMDLWHFLQHRSFEQEGHVSHEDMATVIGILKDKPKA